MASGEAWDCFFDREILDYGDHVTKCGWYDAFTEEEKRPDTLYYRTFSTPDAETAGFTWTDPRLQALTDIFQEITMLTGVSFVHEDSAPQVSSDQRVEFRQRIYDTLSVSLHLELEGLCSRVDLFTGACGGYAKASLPSSVNFNDPSSLIVPTYPVVPHVRIGPLALNLEAQAFAGILRHELLHAVFGFRHSSTPSSIMYATDEGADRFSPEDEEMLRLYGDIPYGVEWEEIQQRACIGVKGICYQLYE